MLCHELVRKCDAIGGGITITNEVSNPQKTENWQSLKTLAAGLVSCTVYDSRHILLVLLLLAGITDASIEICYWLPIKLYIEISLILRLQLYLSINKFY